MGCIASNNAADHAISEAQGSAAKRYFGVETLPVSVIAVAQGKSGLKLTVVGLDSIQVILLLEIGFEKHNLLVRHAELTRTGDLINHTFVLERYRSKRENSAELEGLNLADVDMRLVSSEEASNESGFTAVESPSRLLRVSISGGYGFGMRASINTIFARTNRCTVAGMLRTTGPVDNPQINDVYWTSLRKDDRILAGGEKGTRACFELQYQVQETVFKATSVPLCYTEAGERESTPPKIYAARNTAQMLNAIREEDERQLRCHIKGLPSALHKGLSGVNYPIRGPQTAGVQIDGFVKYVGAGLIKSRYKQNTPVLEIRSLFIRENASERADDAGRGRWLKQFLKADKEYAEFVTWLDIQGKSWTIFKAFLNDILTPGKGYGSQAIAEHLLQAPETFLSAGTSITSGSQEMEWPSWLPCFIDSISDLELIHICDVVNWNTYALMSLVKAKDLFLKDGTTAASDFFGSHLKWAVQQELQNSGFTEECIVTLSTKEIFAGTTLGKLVLNVLKTMSKKLQVEWTVTDVEVIISDSYERIAGELMKEMSIKVHVCNDHVGGDFLTALSARSTLAALNDVCMFASPATLDDVAALPADAMHEVFMSCQTPTASSPPQISFDSVNGVEAPEKTLDLDRVGRNNIDLDKVHLDKHTRGLIRQVSGVMKEASERPVPRTQDALDGARRLLFLAISFCDLIHLLQKERSLSCLAVARAGQAGVNDAKAEGTDTMNMTWNMTNKKSSWMLSMLDTVWNISATEGMDTIHRHFGDGVEVFKNVFVKVLLQRKVVTECCKKPPQSIWQRYLFLSFGATGYTTLIGMLNDWMTQALRALPLNADEFICLRREHTVLALFKEQLSRELAFLACKGDLRLTSTAEDAQPSDVTMLDNLLKVRHRLNELVQLDLAGDQGPLFPQFVMFSRDIESELKKETSDPYFCVAPGLLATWLAETSQCIDGMEEAMQTLMHQLHVPPQFTSESNQCLPSIAAPFPIANAALSKAELKINDVELATNVVSMLRDRHFTRIVALVGAGISVSANIPDFRSAGGLYDQLSKKGLSAPESVFTANFLEQNPATFYEVMSSLFVDAVPTLTHYFLRLLCEKGMLLRCYTQNIDGLERKAGIPAKYLVESHGTLARAKCSKCSKPHPSEDIKFGSKNGDRFPRCGQCSSLLRPDIVFFGESLPQRFTVNALPDLKKADLVLVMGTSLSVEPFASLAQQTNVPRVVLNLFLPKTLRSTPILKRLAGVGEEPLSDVHLLGQCDDGVTWLASHVGWEDELKALSCASTDGTALSRRVSFV